MSIESERKELLRRIRKEGRHNYKALAKKMRFSHSTLLTLVKETSWGNVKSWAKIERYFKKIDLPVEVNQ